MRTDGSLSTDLKNLKVLIGTIAHDDLLDVGIRRRLTRLDLVGFCQKDPVAVEALLEVFLETVGQPLDFNGGYASSASSTYSSVDMLRGQARKKIRPSNDSSAGHTLDDRTQELSDAGSVTLALMEEVSYSVYTVLSTRQPRSETPVNDHSSEKETLETPRAKQIYRHRGARINACSSSSDLPDQTSPSVDRTSLGDSRFGFGHAANEHAISDTVQSSPDNPISGLYQLPGSQELELPESNSSTVSSNDGEQSDPDTTWLASLPPSPTPGTAPRHYQLSATAFRGPRENTASGFTKKTASPPSIQKPLNFDPAVAAYNDIQETPSADLNYDDDEDPTFTAWATANDEDTDTELTAALITELLLSKGFTITP